MLKFGFVCRPFVLFCCSDVNTPRPCSTNAIGGSHCFLPPADPQGPIVVIPFQTFRLEFIKNHYPISNGHKTSWFKNPYTIKLTRATTYYFPLIHFKILLHPLCYTSVLIPQKYSAREKSWLRYLYFRPTSQVRYQVAVTKK